MFFSTRKCLLKKVRNIIEYSFLKWNIPIYLFIYIFGKHVLKRPRSYWCLGVLTNVVRWVFDFVTNPWFWFYWIFKSKESLVMIFQKKIRFKEPLVLVIFLKNSKNRRVSGKSWQRTVSSWAVLSTTKLQKYVHVCIDICYTWIDFFMCIEICRIHICKHEVRYTFTLDSQKE